MKKHLLKRIPLIIGAIIGLLVIAVLIVPLFIKVTPLPDLSTITEIKETESKFITVPFEGTDGIDIHYLERGKITSDNPVFVLLHGSLYNSYTWNQVIDEFGKIGRTVAYDQIPYGLSEKLIEGDWSGPNPYSPNAALQQLISLLDVLDIENAYLVGSSYGGVLAVKAAIKYPERFSGLVLVDPAVFVNESMPGWLVNSPQLDNIGPYFARSIGTGKSFYESCYSDPSLFAGKLEQRSMILTEIENWDFALWEYLKSWGTESSDYISLIQTINIPALIVSGTEDSIVPPEDSQKLDNMLSNSTLKMINGIGHLPHEEAPSQFLEIAIPWIKSKAIY